MSPNMNNIGLRPFSINDFKFRAKNGRDINFWNDIWAANEPLNK